MSHNVRVHDDICTLSCFKFWILMTCLLANTLTVRENWLFDLTWQSDLVIGVSTLLPRLILVTWPSRGHGRCGGRTWATRAFVLGCSGSMFQRWETCLSVYFQFFQCNFCYLLRKEINPRKQKVRRQRKRKLERKRQKQRKMRNLKKKLQKKTRTKNRMRERMRTNRKNKVKKMEKERVMKRKKKRKKKEKRTERRKKNPLKRKKTATNRHV